MNKRPTFQIGSPHKTSNIVSETRALEVLEQPSVPLRYSYDDRTFLEVQKDDLVQDFMVHADLWIGIFCLIGSIVFLVTPYFPETLRVIAYGIIFWLSFAAGLWLVILAVMTGVLHKTNQGKGLTPINSDPVKGAEDPLQVEKDAAAAVGEGLPQMVRLGLLFVVESGLLVMGVYLQGVWQYLLGFIGLIILTVVFVQNIRDSQVRAEVNRELEAIAAKRSDQYVAMPADVPRAGFAPRASSMFDHDKLFRLFVLTSADVSLASMAMFSCTLIDTSDEATQWFVFFSLFASGGWLVILGWFTGYGNPGHHEHPLDLEENEKVSKSMCEILAEVRAQAKKGVA